MVQKKRDEEDPNALHACEVFKEPSMLKKKKNNDNKMMRREERKWKIDMDTWILSK